jgi:hypothetical protein
MLYYNLSKSFKSAYEYKTTTSQNHSNKLMNTRLQPLKIIQKASEYMTTVIEILNLMLFLKVV